MGRRARGLEGTDLLRARFGTPPLRIGELEAACWAALPLQVGDGPRVVLAFGFRGAGSFPPEEQALLSAAAEQVEVALERAERFEAERGGRQRAEQVQALTEELAVAERPEQVLAVLTGRARLLLGAAAGLGGRGRSIRAGPAAGLACPDRAAVPAEMDEAGAAVDEAALPEALLAALHAGLPSVTGTAADWPLDTGGRSSGALHYDFSPPLGQRAVGEVAVTLAAVAALSGQALGRTGRSAFEHEVAVTLQRAMLPLQIDVTDLDVAAAYQPASERMEVGGDWYDVLPLDDGRLALIVVTSWGGAFRRPPRWGGCGTPAGPCASCRARPSSSRCSTRWRPRTPRPASPRSSAWSWTWPGDGHLRHGRPPATVAARPDGTVALLEGANSLPLGLRGAVVRPEATVDLPAWAMLLLYTDGLVERRGESIDAGLARLCDVVAGQRDIASRQVVDRAVEQLLHGGEHHDDVAILCAQRLPPGSLRSKTNRLRRRSNIATYCCGGCPAAAAGRRGWRRRRGVLLRAATARRRGRRPGGRRCPAGRPRPRRGGPGPRRSTPPAVRRDRRCRAAASPRRGGRRWPLAAPTVPRRPSGRLFASSRRATVPSGARQERWRVAGRGVGGRSPRHVHDHADDRGEAGRGVLGRHRVEQREELGRAVTKRRARVACRSRPIAVAAGRPRPTTSPTISARRPSSRGSTSYQSPPTSIRSLAGW